MTGRQAEILAMVLVQGEWSHGAVLQRLYAVLGNGFRKRKWPSALVDAVFHCADFQLRRPGQSQLAEFLRSSPQVIAVTKRSAAAIAKATSRLLRLPLPQPLMLPTTAKAAGWSVPSVTTPGQLADVLGLPYEKLLRLADVSGREYVNRIERHRNYRYAWIQKRSGTPRLLEIPKRRLKTAQRWITRHILNHIPPHAAAHGFVQGRSCMTAARIHAGRKVVLRIDLRNFFPSVAARRVAGIFRTAGYPSRVVSLLTGLCTNTSSRHIIEHAATAKAECPESAGRNQFREYLLPHLPQGAPTSPCLANLCAWSLDCRLTGLADKFGAHYTRYADDLVFSGDSDFAVRLQRFRVLALAIVHNEGFEIRNRKTQVMGHWQQQKINGLIVNGGVGVPRREYDLLKAILTNCRRFGPESQNRTNHSNFESHLRGRIAYINSISPKKAKRLQAMFERIEW